MRKKRTPEWINTQKANINWVHAYVEAITNNRPLSLINRNTNKTYKAHMAMYEQLDLALEGVTHA